MSIWNIFLRVWVAAHITNMTAHSHVCLMCRCATFLGVRCAIAILHTFCGEMNRQKLLFCCNFYDFLRFLIGLFIHFWISGEWEKAIPIFTEAIEINATSAMPFVKRGQCFMKLSKPNACIRDCTRAIEINPDNAAAHKYRGRAHR